MPDRREMIWIDFNPQVGLEMKDEHPMLILSGKAFNERTNLAIGLLVTHAPSNKTNPFAVKFSSSKGEVCYVLDISRSHLRGVNVGCDRTHGNKCPPQFLKLRVKN